MMNFNSLLFTLLMLFTVSISAQQVIEVTRFNLNTGVDTNVFEDRDAEIEADFASQQPGFLKRETGVDQDGRYVVMVFWESLADADASIAAFGADPTVGDYFGMIDTNTFTAERFEALEPLDLNFELDIDNVIEITTFDINDGVDAQTFEDRDAEIDADFASQQPGYIKRMSGVNVESAGNYAVIVFWEALADADASIAAFQVDPTVGDYFAMIDVNTFAANRYTVFNENISQQVIEVTRFNLNTGVDTNVFEDRDAEIEADFASQQPGFLKRETGVDQDGRYVVMVFWESLADADASIAAFGADPTVGDYFGMIDTNTFTAERFEALEPLDLNFELDIDNVIEITTFDINDGVDAQTFEDRDAEIDADFASQQPGYIKRMSGVNVESAGNYAVIVFWEALADADASIAAFQVDPTVGDYFAMIDVNTFAANRYTVFNNGISSSTDCVPIGENAFPEDIVINNGQLYSSNFFNGAITQVDLTTGTISEFLSPATGALSTAWGLEIDVANNLLLSVANIAWDFNPANAAAGALNAYDLSTGTLVNSWTFPAQTIGHEITIDNNGNYYVGDFGPDARVIKIDPSTNTVSVWADDVQWPDANGGIGGIVFNGTNGIYLAQSDLFWYVPINPDGTAGVAQQVTFTGGNNTVAADGIVWMGNNTIYYCVNDAFTPGPNGTFNQIVLDSPTTGTQTVLASDIADASGAAFDPATNTLYAAASQFGAAFGVDGAPNNPFCLRTFEYTPIQNDNVPTVGEWGLIILCLLLLNTVLISAVVNGQTSLLFSNGQTYNKQFRWNDINAYPFNKEVFVQAVTFTVLLVTLIALYALTFYGFFTLVDIIGITIASPLFAYLMHLMILSNQKAA